jgi:DNA invertase Pin-like site-specific DNA recombinase
MEKESALEETLVQKIRSGSIKAKDLLSQYCAFLYKQFGTYEEVARCTGLDRRTVKKYLPDALLK